MPRSWAEELAEQHGIKKLFTDAEVKVAFQRYGIPNAVARPGYFPFGRHENVASVYVDDDRDGEWVAVDCRGCRRDNPEMSAGRTATVFAKHIHKALRRMQIAVEIADNALGSSDESLHIAYENILLLVLHSGDLGIFFPPLKPLDEDELEELKDREIEDANDFIFEARKALRDAYRVLPSLGEWFDIEEKARVAIDDSIERLSSWLADE